MVENVSNKTAVINVKPVTDVCAGALARAASQSTIHPLDTIKVFNLNFEQFKYLNNELLYINNILLVLSI